ncbi:TetR/AcrR family transcriptional regulator C-terminal domain-containing protein [Actinomadura barringtoniae]|uniref:TetR/AcrR family transcriptional regulator C-terminal domain-containing protein n=1 Tax=Actinomadura barringtoniae TaxID=1427535 RepID=A0A939PQD4_9ACTN|nr:TetR/AcrR family transcriptional regulator [Actinomadura barringtoniae]MBO2454229.1 TetR/AcrR family transcriptional regulator C-terminal domain-containing protein [Actinomadura barringtoniae]
MPPKDKAIPSVWARPRKKEHPALSQERIVAEAIQLLDAEGIESLSMRSLGTRLNAGATSLYRHVANKDELIELVVDEVYGELEVPAAGDPNAWREAIAGFAASLRAMALRHPWVATLLGQVGLVQLGPNVSRLSEAVIAVFNAAGFSVEESDKAMGTVISYVVGLATNEAAYLSMLARSGQTETEFVENLRAAAEDNPELPSAPAAQLSQDPSEVRDENFDYGLQRVLDGLAVRLDQIKGS